MEFTQTEDEELEIVKVESEIHSRLSELSDRHILLSLLQSDCNALKEAVERDNILVENLNCRLVIELCRLQVFNSSLSSILYNEEKRQQLLHDFAKSLSSWSTELDKALVFSASESLPEPRGRMTK